MSEFYKVNPRGEKIYFREGSAEEIAALSYKEKLDYERQIEDPKLEDRRLEFQAKLKALLTEYEDSLAPRLRDKDEWKGEMGRVTIKGNRYYVVHDWEAKNVCDVCAEDLDED